MEPLLDGLARRATWTNAAIAVGVLAVANVMLAGYILPSIAAIRPEALEDDFLVMIDREPLLSVDEMYRIFDLYQPDILGLVQLLYAVDFVMPLAFGCLFACLIGKLLRYLEVKAGAWRVALLLPFAAIPFDYTENLLSLVLTSEYQEGRVFPVLARVATVATACKFLGLALTGLATVVLLVRTVVKRVASRRGM